jgi:hypothetical protein
VIVVVDVKLLRVSRRGRWLISLEFVLQSRVSAVDGRLVVDKLFSQALDLIVGVEKHLPQLGHAQL